MIKKISLLMLIVILTLSLFGCSDGGSANNEASSGKPVTWRITHEEVVGSVQDVYANKFKELIEEKSAGKIKVEVYPVGQLGDGVTQVELLQDGGVDFAINNPGAVATIIPENQVFSLQFLLSDDMDVNQKVMTEGAAKDELNNIYLKKGIKVLDWFTEGFQMWTGNKSLTSIDDFKGFKMRTMASPMISAGYEAYGANPTPIPYMEVYSSLQLNMIDGQVNPIFAIEEMKFYEVQKYLMMSKQNTFVGTFCVNPDFWDTLGDSDKGMVESIVPELNKYIFEVQENLNTERLEKIKEVSDIQIVELTDGERDSFKEASIPVRDVYVNEVGEKGKKILDLLIKDVEKFENEK